MDLEDSMAKSKDTFTTRGGWWVVAQFGLLAVVIGVRFIELPFAKWPFEAHRWVGATLMTVGVLQLGKAALDLGHSLTPMPKPTDQSTLKTNGIYRFVRHPIYGGLMMDLAEDRSQKSLRIGKCMISSWSSKRDATLRPRELAACRGASADLR